MVMTTLNGDIVSNITLIIARPVREDDIQNRVTLYHQVLESIFEKKKQLHQLESMVASSSSNVQVNN